MKSVHDDYGDGGHVYRRDYSERYQATPDGETQSEHFSKDESLSMEGIVADIGVRGVRRQIFFNFLSDDKDQNHATVHEDTWMLISELIKQRKLTNGQLKRVFEITDGCSAQYRSAKVLYLLAKISTQFQILYVV